MAVDNADVTFILHQKYDLRTTCRTCLMNINQSQNQLIPIFDSEMETNNVTPEIILNECLFLKLKVNYTVVVISIIHLTISLFILLKLSQNDGLPQQICNKCFTNLLNIREFRKICEQSQDVLEKFFKISSEMIASSTEPSKSVTVITEMSEQNFSDFEFLNIDNVEYDTKIEVERKLWYGIVN